MASKYAEDGSKCSICFETYKEPKALVCLHTYCESCIHEYILKSKENGLLCDGIECPLCRFVTKCDTDKPIEEWAKSLRPNFALASLLESASFTENCSDEDVKSCQPCLKQKNNNASIIFCTVCNERLCEECKKVHNRLKLTKGHECIDIESKENVELFTTFQAFQKCKQHGKKVKFFCKDEDTFCCSTCAIIAHRGCTGLVEISALATEMSIATQASVLSKQISELGNTTKMSEAHFVKESKKLTLKGTDLMDNLRKLKEKVNKRFDDIEEKLKDEVNSMQTSKLSEILKNTMECNEIISELRRLKRILELAHQNGTREQLFVIVKKLRDEFSRIKCQVELKYGRLESLNLSLRVSATLEDLLNTTGEVVSLSVETEIEIIPNCSAKTLNVIAEAFLGQDENDENDPWYRGIGFLSDGRIVAVDHHNKICVVVNENLQKVGEISLKVSPLNLTVTDEDLIIITSGADKKVCLYQVNKNNSLTEEGIIPVSFKCDSVSIIDKTKCVVGTFDNTEPAHVFKLSGDFTGLNFDFEGKQFDSGNFKCCFTEETKQLLITDNKGNAVFLCDTEKGKTTKVQDDRLVKPKGISHYMDDMYFVCCSGTDSILQITTSGKVLAATKINMRGPYSIAVSKDKSKLIVSNGRVGVKKNDSI